MLNKLIDDIANGYSPSLSELEELLNLENEQCNYLFGMANNIRKSYCGDEVHIRGIIEFSNYCRCECIYCGINKMNKALTRYRMDLDEIIETAQKAYKTGYRTIVLQSGEDSFYTQDRITKLITEIKKIGDIAITLSIGERKNEEYQEWFKSGADRYLIKHETADYHLYNKLHPCSNYKDRILSLKQLKEVGYQIGSGFIVGLPGQTMKIIAKDLLLLDYLKVDMAGIGPFIPHPQTPLGLNETGSSFLTLKTIAIARILLKDTHLPATTALKVANNKDMERAFSVGANVTMHKLESLSYRELYNIYPNKVDNNQSIEHERRGLEDLILKLGRKIADSTGESIKKGRI